MTSTRNARMTRAVRGHREIEHTADLGFEVWAPDLPGLYAEAVGALAELCYERESVRPTEERLLHVMAATPEERLVRWLQEIYLWLESEGWLAADSLSVRCQGDEVLGTVRGEHYDENRHTLHTEIKAITYHDLEVERVGDSWRSTVIVDV